MGTHISNSDTLGLEDAGGVESHDAETEGDSGLYCVGLEVGRYDSVPPLS